MATVEEILAYSFAGNTVKEYVIALCIFLLGIAVLKIFKYIVVRKLKDLSKKTETDIDDLVIDIIDGIGWPFYVLLSSYVCLYFIKVPELLHDCVKYAFFLIALYSVVKGVHKLIDYATDKFQKKREKEEPGADNSLIELLNKIAKVVVWISAFLLLISNLGFDISTLLAGLGIGGIAVAFALQNVLSDIFASFSIYFDKPFKKGDVIVIGSDSGTVQNIGIKTTRLRAVNGGELIISNRDLTNSRIQNLRNMEKRRVIFTLGVTYDTPVRLLKRIPETIKGLINKVKHAEAERVHFKQFGDSSLMFEISYLVDSNDFVRYMDVQQEINLAIAEQFEKEGIKMAFPTHTIHVDGGGKMLPAKRRRR